MKLFCRLDIYLSKQLIITWLFSVGLLSAVGVAIGTLSDLAYQISNYNLPVVIAVKIFYLKLPEYVAYGLPIGTLLTTLIVYGRLNRESELVALQSLGVSLNRIIYPVFFLSLFIGLITFLLNELLVPQANYQIILLQQPYIPEIQLVQQKKDIFYPEYQSNSLGEKQLHRLYYATKFDGNKLHNIVVLQWHQHKLQQIITAQSASWDEKLKLWRMQQTKIENILNQNVRSFENNSLALPNTLFKISQLKQDPYLMSIIEAKQYLTLIKDTGNSSKIRLFQVRIQQKIAFPFICPIFALFGSTLGSTTNNLNRGKSFGLCVFISFGYYLLAFAIGSLGIVGLIHPLISAWLPNAMVICLIFQMSKSIDCTN